MTDTEDNRLLILGTGTFAEEIADVAAEMDGFQIAGFIENRDRSRCERPLQSLPVHWVDELVSLAGTHQVICGLGTTLREQFTDQADALGVRYATLIHPTARVSPTSTLDAGCIVSVRSVIAAHSHLARHVSVNRGALIGHHTRIDEFVTVGPGANIAGNCIIGPRTYVGMGAIVIDHITIGAGCVIGAGAVVTKDLPDRVLAVGIPARIARENIDPK